VLSSRAENCSVFYGCACHDSSRVFECDLALAITVQLVRHKRLVGDRDKTPSDHAQF